MLRLISVAEADKSVSYAGHDD